MKGKSKSLPAWQRKSIGAAVLIAALALLVVSVLCNATFAASLGQSDFERRVLVAASIASDVFKAAAPAIVLWLVYMRAGVAATFAGILGIIAICFSVVASFGFLAKERYRAFDTAEAAYAATVDAKDDIERLKTRAAWAATDQPASVLEAKQMAMMADSRFRATAECTDARGRNEDWCREYRELGVQVVAAAEREKAEAVIAEKRAFISSDGRQRGDTHAEFFAKATGLPKSWVVGIFVILGVALIEFGSTMGITVALAVLGGVDRNPIADAAKAVQSAADPSKPPEPVHEQRAATVHVVPKPKPPPPRRGGLKSKIVATG